MPRALCEPRTAGDRCPGALALHEAQDGWLARVRVPGGRLSAGQLGALAHAAELGNGLVDLTSRGNLQVRGLPADAGVRLAELLREAGLLPSEAHDRARNVVASPLAGRQAAALADTDAVVAELDRRLCADPALAELPGRFLFAVDDGSGLALGHTADVALVARDAQRFGLALAGEMTDIAAPAARAAPSEAAPSGAATSGAAPSAASLAIGAAHAFLAARGAERSWRIAELPDGAEAVAARIGATLTGALARKRVALSPGWLVQRDGRRALTALVPLGRLDAEALAALAELGGEVRLSTERTITLVDLDARAAEATVTGRGLVVEDGSGWVGLTACAGLGRCAKAGVDVRAAAARRAAVRRPDAPREHWAACERRCGERAGQPVAVVACRDGLTVRRGDDERVVADVPEALAVLA
jgi:precorrin-3B synthase